MKVTLGVSRIKGFLHEVMMELKKVSWPTTNEVYGTTLVVLSFIFLLAIYLKAIDMILSLVERWIFKLFR
jgi:preprotein translocase subunit SecE